jgi:hypothetical protein
LASVAAIDILLDRFTDAEFNPHLELAHACAWSIQYIQAREASLSAEDCAGIVRRHWDNARLVGNRELDVPPEPTVSKLADAIKALRQLKNWARLQESGAAEQEDSPVPNRKGADATDPSANGSLQPPDKRRRIPRKEAERKVATALKKLTAAKTPSLHNQRRQTVRINDVEERTGLPKSSVASTHAWKEFEQQRLNDGLAPKRFGGNQRIERPLTDATLALHADPKAGDPAQALVDLHESDDAILRWLYDQAKTDSEREALNRKSPRERQEMIELIRSHRKDQGRS